MIGFVRRLLSVDRDTLYWLTSDLAIGPAPESRDWTAIWAAGIRTALDLRQEYEGEATACDGLELRRFPIREGHAPLVDELDSIAGWVAERMETNGPVLVYCREGRGRSALVACAVLLRLGFRLPDAYQLLRRARPEAQLSDAQAACLEELALG